MKPNPFVATFCLTILTISLQQNITFARVFADDSGRTVDANLAGVRGDKVILEKITGMPVGQ